MSVESKEKTKAVAPKAIPVEVENAERMLPNTLRYLICGLLVASVLGIVTFGYIKQSSVKPPVNTAQQGQNCKDPVTENRLRETLKQSPNDYATLMDWGVYNLSCEKNYPAAVAAFQQATFIAGQANSTISELERTESEFRLGMAYLFNQNFPEAEAQFKRIIEHDPKNTSAMFGLSAALQKDKPQEAVTYLKKILEIEEPGSSLAKEAQNLLNSLTTTSK